MPRKDCILNLPGFSIQKVTNGNPMVFELSFRRKARCTYCDHPRIRKKASFIRQVRHEPIGYRQVLLRFKAYKFQCYACRRYFNQRFPGINKHQRATEHLRNHVFRQHTQGISQSALANDFKLGKATIERWYHSRYELEYQQLKNKPCPQVLGIDEHSFSKKQGYVTTLCNLKKHKIFDVVKGKSSQNLASYLEQLPGKDKVKVVCMDLSSTYRSIIQNYFPNAKIVADRFHVIRLMLHQCLQTYQEIDPLLKYKRGLLAALRTHHNRLTVNKQLQRDAYLKQNPAIAAIYNFKCKLHRLLTLKHRKAKHCRRLIPIFLSMMNELKNSPFKRLMTLGKTLDAWKEEVVRMWRFTKTNGITEGFHRKMKLIQRRAYGFRNFENYRLRVKVLCS